MRMYIVCYFMYSAAFDVPLCIADLAYEILIGQGMKVSPLKKGSRYLAVTWDQGRLLDFSCYATPGTPLERFMKTHRIADGKLLFPHAQFNSKTYLHDTIDFPPHEAFWNDFKKRLVATKEEYEISKQFYIRNKCANMAEYLLLYNARDTVREPSKTFATFQIFIVIICRCHSWKQ